MDDTVLADRYGRAPSRRRRRLAVGAGALVLVAAVGWFAWAAVRGGSSVSGTTVGYQVEGNGQVQVTFDVSKPQGRSATCTVQALDSGFAVVGSVVVRVGPTDHDVVRTTTTVRTTNQATSGQVTTCELALG